MNDKAAEPVPSVHNNAGRSIIIRHTVRPEFRERYETWLKQIIAAAAEFPGHEGVHILRPPEGHDTFEIAVRFSSNSAAEAWLGSNIRKELLSSIVFALASDEQLEIKSGIDFWFTPPASKAKQPTRWKQWLITTAVIWPLTIIIPVLYQPLFNIIPAISVWGVRHGIIAATIVALVVYLIMPRVVRLVAGWLFR
ncbi:antibiotic biosynthesis monooxygenase [Halomonas profundus]|uniref:Antibiotic biosynthesis monooxygenase n=1 Tax=Vreelandella titanicae TaxID=664683 RepID=A0A558J668_9GAMM|nr:MULTISPECIES: antibiotic biosynthesis monooxygenase [Halomonas]NAO97009.1 antibiotic biosynthesis monooxygenase [Halomonas sp. MG34]QGQ70455.1 antibiotic biosynthesis monooxygenase [Halomonas sp. PA16-9]UEQ06283.1 antibiotic biosynthesis monooxygenase [Halomonas profundus]PKH59662.1 antibiotic biosynthesis monooxygenase [Halomonas sp. Choline-3u-9]TVU89148.1 antibiotic biosynthesis monooxygenase [Halomonas titanicae]